MTLTFGRSPFGADRGRFDITVPDHVAYVELWREMWVDGTQVQA